MSKYMISIRTITFVEFEKARDEVRELVSARLFEWVKNPDDLQKHIDNLPAIQKDIAMEKVTEAVYAFDELCRMKGYGAAYLKYCETVSTVRNKIQVSDINVRDLFIITAVCNKVATIISDDIDDYDCCNLLVTIDGIVEKPSSLTVCDSSHPC